ncbi:hypothetical protein QBC35DRAFT_510551 [Podospora australis]|uniref:Uncharacterized protein n=1 Tax=Podospora australis TaxID=1536484 RepID=A0AAN7AD45_9PEZI|nr:hypothetical protein QBC35DRAFT_510551 [Podospora australis]
MHSLSSLRLSVLVQSLIFFFSSRSVAASTNSNTSTAAAAATESTATLGRSQIGITTTTSTTSTTNNHQLNAFIDQDFFDDGTLHGRIPDDSTFYFHPDEYIHYYEDRAESLIEDFDAVFYSAGPETPDIDMVESQ